MSVLIQARVPDDLATAARQRAGEQEKSLSAYVADLMRQDMQAARRERFWAEVERTMTTPEAKGDLAAEAAALEGTLADGIEP